MGTMAGIAEGRIDAERLVRLYRKSEAARAVLDYCAQRQNNSRETTVDRLEEALAVAGSPLLRSDIVEVFRELDRAACGRFVVGRKGKPSRFEWVVGLTDVGRAARGEPVAVPPIRTSDLDGDEVESSEARRAPHEMREHRYWLRSELEVRLALPKDLVQAEADRLAEFIRTLPLSST
jgi:hypothetical protein